MLWPLYCGGCGKPPTPPLAATSTPAPPTRPPATAPCGPASGPELFFEAQPRHAHKEVRQPHQRHMVVPTHPGTRLVLRQTQVALGVLKEILDLMTRARGQCQHAQRRLRSTVADVVFDLGVLLQRTADQHPDRRTGLAVPDRPDPHRCELEDQRADRALAHLQPMPGSL